MHGWFLSRDAMPTADQFPSTFLGTFNEWGHLQGLEIASVKFKDFQRLVLSQEIGWEERLQNDLFCVVCNTKP